MNNGEIVSAIFLSSGNATYKNLATAVASFDVQPPIMLPPNRTVKVCCQSASYTNYFLNVQTGINDAFYYTDDVLITNKYSVTVPQGSYSVSDLSDAINAGVVNNGHTSGLISLIPDFSSNRVLFSIAAVGWQINMLAGTPYLLLGATLNQKIPAGGLTTGAYSQLAPNVATFNSITELFLHTSLTNNSVYSGRRSDVVLNITPTASIGSIQRVEPYNLIWIPANELSGTSINNIRVYWTDQTGASVQLSDDFAATVLLSIA
jgi:hypothetical protein